MRIFISHAREQGDLAHEMSIKLRDEGHTTFVSTTSLRPGEPFERSIRSALRRSHLLIFLISPESMTPGRFPLSEVELFEKVHPQPANHVLPVSIGNGFPVARLPAYLRAASVLTSQGDPVPLVLARVDEISRRLTGRRILVAALTAFVGVAVGALPRVWPVRPDRRNVAEHSSAPLAKQPSSEGSSDAHSLQAAEPMPEKAVVGTTQNRTGLAHAVKPRVNIPSSPRAAQGGRGTAESPAPLPPVKCEWQRQESPDGTWVAVCSCNLNRSFGILRATHPQERASALGLSCP